VLVDHLGERAYARLAPRARLRRTRARAYS
jgi:hypothetical protein